MLVNSKSVLEEAKRSRHCIIAPDYIDMDSARTFVHEAEAMNQPIILSYAEVFRSFFSLEEAAAIGKVAAESVKIPIVLHLDHGEHFEFIKKANDLGFTSVMIDASSETFEENVRRTREVIDYAHPRGVTVEAEIGHVGMGENYEAKDDTDSIYTTVEEAMAFAEQTGVDSLAVSIGTAHGKYKNAVEPVLNFERLHELDENISIPLVLHGSSGSGDQNLYRCATEGISKMNIYTDFLVGAMEQVRLDNPSEYIALKQSASHGMGKVLRHYFALFAK